MDDLKNGVNVGICMNFYIIIIYKLKSMYDWKKIVDIILKRFFYMFIYNII